MSSTGVNLIQNLSYYITNGYIIMMVSEHMYGKLGPSSFIAISMYQRFGVSDISQIQSFGVSKQFRPTLTFWSETEISCAFVNIDIAKTVGPTVLTGKFLLGPTIFVIRWCRSVWRFDDKM